MNSSSWIFSKFHRRCIGTTLARTQNGWLHSLRFAAKINLPNPKKKKGETAMRQQYGASITPVTPGELRLNSTTPGSAFVTAESSYPSRPSVMRMTGMERPSRLTAFQLGRCIQPALSVVLTGCGISSSRRPGFGWVAVTLLTLGSLLIAALCFLNGCHTGPPPVF